MYSDKNFFLTKISQTELDNLTGAVDANLDAAIESADGLIDSYLQTVTAVPLAIVPAIVKQLSYDIAVFFLHDRIQYNEIPQRVKDKYDSSIFFLKDVAAGKANLPGISADVINGTVNYLLEGGNLMTRNSF